MPATTITSLAILKANWDYERRDYTENFVPILAESIRLTSSDVISTPELQEHLRSQFGLSLPQNVINTILKRVSRAKYITKKHGVYYKDESKLSKLNFNKLQQEVIMKHDVLVRSLIEFGNDRYNVKFSSDQVEAALQAYIDDNQISIIDAKYKNTVIPHTEYPDKTYKYLVASFIKFLQDTHSPLLEYFETVVKGNMLANAIFLPDTNHAPKMFRNTEIYFDTSFILYALGYAGEARQAPCTELLQLLQSFGALLRCFSHTIDESRGILDACARRIASGQLKDSYGPSILYFISKKYTATDIALFSEKIESDLNKLNISIVSKPTYNEHDYVIDEAGLGRVLNQPNGKNGRISLRQEVYRNEVALRRDVDSVSAIMRLRRGILPFYYEGCRALFVTTNNHLTSVSQKLFYNDVASNVIPPCQMDYALTNILWLKHPTKAPELPRKRIIADSFASMQPSDFLWRAYIAEIDKQKLEKRFQEEDYYLLRYTMEAKYALMEVTLGDEEAFTQGTVPEVLDLVKEQMVKEKEEELGQQIDDKQRSLEEAYVMLQEREKIITEGKTRERERLERIERRSDRIASLFGKMLLTLSLVLVVTATYFTFPWETPNLTESPFRFGVGLILILLFALSVLNIMFGTRVLDLVKFIEQKMANYFKLLMLKLSE